VKRNANFFKATASLVMSGIVATVVTSCTESTTVEPTELQEPTYSISGTVVDGSGSTKGNLPGVIVGISGIDTIVSANNGMFLIDDIPYGDRALSFEYLDTAATPVDYTTAVYTVTGQGIDENEDDTTTVLNIKDQAGTVVLFPLDGSLTGTINRQVDDNSTPVPAEGIVVTADFVVAAGNAFTGQVVPETRFTATTDANGQYSFTGLPVSARAADALNLSIANTVDASGNTWKIKAGDVNAPQGIKLTRGVTVTAETINLEPTKAAAKALELVSSASFLDATKGEQFDLDRSAALTVSFVKDIDAASLNIAVGDGIKTTPITVTVDPADAKTVTITPKSGLWISDDSKTITIRGTLVDGTEVVLNNHKLNFVSENANGKDLVTSASFLTANKTVAYDVSLSDDLVVNFINGVKAADLQVSVGNDQDITMTVVDSTVTVSPVTGVWMGGTPKLNIDGTLVDGTIIKFSETVNFENELAIIKSNVTINNDMTIAIEGIEADQDIILEANQDVVKVIARLYQATTVANGTAANEVSSSVAIDGTNAKMITVTPSMQLAHGQVYSLRVTTFNADGETDLQDINGFRIEESDLYVTANSMLDENGDAVIDYNLFDPIVLTFNMPLDTDLNNITWAAPGGGAKMITADKKGNAAPNATATLDATGTILTIQVDKRENIAFGDDVGINITVRAANGEILNVPSYIVSTAPMGDYLVSSNAQDSLGFDIKMAPSDPITAVFGFDIATINFSAGNVVLTKVGAGVQPQPLSSEITIVGNTVTYTPQLPLDEGADYTLELKDVELTNGMKQVALAPITWKTVDTGILVSVNNTENNLFRALPASGGSFTVGFDKLIDATRPITVIDNGTGLDFNGGNYTVTVDATTMSVTVTPTSPLNLAGFDTDYTDETVATYDLTVTGKTAADIAVTSGVFQIFTEEGLFCVDASYAKVNNTSTEVDDETVVVDEFAIADPITLTFTREIDATTLEDGIILNVEGAQVPATAALDATLKIVTITPTVALTLGTYFTVEVTADLAGVAVDGVDNGNADAFESKVLYTALKAPTDLSTLAAPVIAETADDERNYNNGTNLNFDLTRPAYGVDYRESVTSYEVVAKNGTEGIWSTDTNDVNSDLDYSVFGTALVSTSAVVGNDLRQESNDVAYDNGLGLFATGDSITVKVRSVLEEQLGFEDNGFGNPIAVDNVVYGAWSTELVFGDNVAPCDSNLVNTWDLDDASDGGVDVNSSAIDLDGVSSINESQKVILTFPEDMDISVKPTALVPARGTSVDVADGAITVADGEWTDARTYEQSIVLSKVFDYTYEVAFVPGVPAIPAVWDETDPDPLNWFIITPAVPAIPEIPGVSANTGWGITVDVSGFKDVSGVTVDEWGTAGTIDGSLDLDANLRVAGSKSIIGYIQ